MKTVALHCFILWMLYALLFANNRYHHRQMFFPTNLNSEVSHLNHTGFILWSFYGMQKHVNFDCIDCIYTHIPLLSQNTIFSFSLRVLVTTIQFPQFILFSDQSFWDMTTLDICSHVFFLCWFTHDCVFLTVWLLVHSHV